MAKIQKRDPITIAIAIIVILLIIWLVTRLVGG